MATRSGTVKKTEAKQFFDVRRNGIIAINLADGDRLIAAHFVREKDDLVLITQKGQSIRFKESDVRSMGRAAAGVKGGALKGDDLVVGAGVIHSKEGKDKALLVVTSTGYGKKTAMEEYKVQKRGGSGIKTIQITPKTKAIIGAEVINKLGGELVAISKNGVVIRTDLDEVKLQGRQTQGVRIMKLREGDEVASIITLDDSVE
jgi:DNA gyrase subunit A